MEKERRDGFTLIELLVVLGLIMVLAGLLFPGLQRARMAANRTKCVANLSGLGTALRMYLNDFNDVMPVAAAMPSLGLTDEPAICNVLAPYAKSPSAFRCPSDRHVPPYFEQEGSSYQYVTVLGGQKVASGFLTERFGASESPVMHDYEAVHDGHMNYLFEDMHAGVLGD